MSGPAVGSRTARGGAVADEMASGFRAAGLVLILPDAARGRRRDCAMTGKTVTTTDARNVDHEEAYLHLAE